MGSSLLKCTTLSKRKKLKRKSLERIQAFLISKYIWVFCIDFHLEFDFWISI